MRYYMFNKPKGCITARTDKEHKTVMDCFPEDMRDTFHPMGRLDKDTEGLLIITDDGALTYRLMRPEYHVPKTYFFHAIGTLDGEKIKAIETGVKMAGFDIPARPAGIILESEGKITDIAEHIPENRRESYLKCPWQKVFSGYITITEGKNHQVKRMMKAIDCKIVYLKRVAIGGLQLDSSLSEGEYRELTEDEIKILKSAEDTLCNQGSDNS